MLISFHSLEDRLVKDAFREAGRDKVFEVLTKKPVVAGEEEEMTKSAVDEVRRCGRRRRV